MDVQMTCVDRYDIKSIYTREVYREKQKYTY